MIFDGRSFHRQLAADQSLVGIVPQDDVVHPELTVEESLWYTARLRFPPDTRPKQLQVVHLLSGEQRLHDTNCVVESRLTPLIHPDAVVHDPGGRVETNDLVVDVDTCTEVSGHLRRRARQRQDVLRPGLAVDVRDKADETWLPLDDDRSKGWEHLPEERTLER